MLKKCTLHTPQDYLSMTKEISRRKFTMKSEIKHNVTLSNERLTYALLLLKNVHCTHTSQ
jgi:hypothetical protein